MVRIIVVAMRTVAFSRVVLVFGSPTSVNSERMIITTHKLEE